MRHSVRRALALMALAGVSVFGTLQGCGGGGGSSEGGGGINGGGDTGGGNTNPVPPTPYEFLSVGLTSTDTSNNKTLLLVDADNPGTPKLSIGLTDASTNFPATGPRPSLDASSHTVTERPPAMLYFVTGGVVYQVSLRKADSTVPQRISSLTTACAVTGVYPLSLSDGPEDALIEVSERGADGSCVQFLDNTTRYVRTSMLATQAAMALPMGVSVINPLPSATGATTLLVGDTRSGTPKLALYSADLAYLADVSGGSNLSSVKLVGTPSGSSMNAAYVREGFNLRLLTWTSTSATLYGPTYVNRSTPSTAGLPTVTDSMAIYFTDGLEVRRKLTSRSTTDLLGTLDAANGTLVTTVGASTNAVLVLQYTSDGQRASLVSLPKAGGTAVTLLSITLWGGTNPLLGTYGDEVVYADTGRIWRSRADGTNKQLVTDHGSSTKFGMRQPTRAWGSVGDIDAVVWCEIPGSSSYCLNGTLKSLDLASSTTTTLGAFSHTNAQTWYASSYGLNLSGMPAVVLASATPADLNTLVRRQDMYIAQPGRANSLVKVTSLLH
ncbi:hypothetical protein ACVNIS_05225 [Sphaerotilaceae bacterium SBD11-9]